MLRSILTDGAFAAAKSYSHGKVELRHVLFATARHFRDRPGIAAILPLAKSALEPRGSSVALPVLTPEASAMLESFDSEQSALAGVRDAFALEGDTSSSGARAAPPSQDSSPETDTPANDSTTTRESLATILSELDGLIGLDSVKLQIRKVIAVVQANEERGRAGLPQVAPGLHLVFTGPPGTGKTTVARLVARLYAAIGALPAATFIEASRSDLVAGYIGQTAIKTAELIDRARPGVLFIDEAYSLAPSHPTDFGAEAIATLVKAMEDYREDFAVIAAGYGDEMSTLIASNPGLRSRFKTYIDFPNYSPSELLSIFQGFAAANAVELEEGVLGRAEAIFRRTLDKPGFGNARFARSLFEEAYARMSARAAAHGIVHIDELRALTLDDIEWEEGELQRHIRRIGFVTEQQKPLRSADD
mgnify:CR=1 FL=1